MRTETVMTNRLTQIVLLFILCCGTEANAQVLGYSIVLAAPSDELVLRDLETLSFSTIGTTGSITSAALAIRADGTLFSVSYFNDDLWQIDPATGAGTRIGALGVDLRTDAGLTFDACGDLWMVTGGVLYEVDPDTASTSLVADFGGRTVALTADGDQLLTLAAGFVGSPRLARIDPRNGTLALFGDPVPGSGTSEVGLDFDQDGRLWSIHWVDSQIPNPLFTSIANHDPVTGQVLSIVNIPGVDNVGFAGNLAISPPRGICSAIAVPVNGSSLVWLASLLTISGLIMIRIKLQV